MATDRLVKVLEQGRLITRGVQQHDGQVVMDLHDDEQRLITIDWSAWLGSDAIASKATETHGPTVTDSSPSNTQTTLLISGSPGCIQHRITTASSGETVELFFMVRGQAYRDRDYRFRYAYW